MLQLMSVPIIIIKEALIEGFQYFFAKFSTQYKSIRNEGNIYVLALYDKDCVHKTLRAGLFKTAF